MNLLIAAAGVLVLLCIVAWVIFQIRSDGERAHLAELRAINVEQQRTWDAYADDWNTRRGVFEHPTYPAPIPDRAAEPVRRRLADDMFVWRLLSVPLQDVAALFDQPLLAWAGS